MIKSLIEAAIIGVQVGCIYAIVALGLSLIFGIIRVVNFAHGTILMLFLYLGFYLNKFFHMDPYLTAIICVPVAFGFGYLLQFILIRPIFVREKSYVVEPMGILMLMAGADMILTNLGIIVFTPYVKAVETSYGTNVFHLGSIILNTTRTILIPIIIALVIGVNLFLSKTELGNTIRAVGQNREAAAICGINVHHVYALTFGIGCAVTALGGCAILPFTPITPTMGLDLSIKAFIVVVLGGLGSIPGMLLAGVIIGLVESISSQFIATGFSSLLALAVFIIIIVLKPTGLMGKIKV
jgi:branched-chain amino acid transport system permease protein